jgi:hypothetical protein
MYQAYYHLQCFVNPYSDKINDTMMIMVVIMIIKSILYFNVLTHKLQQLITESAPENKINTNIHEVNIIKHSSTQNIIMMKVAKKGNYSQS